MLRPTHPADRNNELKCYLWALCHQAQLTEVDFYPRFYQASKARRFTFDFGLIQGMIYVHNLELFFYIPDSVWISYLEAYGVPKEYQSDYYERCPF